MCSDRLTPSNLHPTRANLHPTRAASWLPAALLFTLSLLLGSTGAWAQGGAFGTVDKFIVGNPTIVQEGEQLEYRLVFSCSSLTAGCGALTITDTLPAGVTYVTGSVAGGFDYDDSNLPEIVISRDPFNDGDSGDATIIVTVDAGQGGNTLTNSALFEITDGPQSVLREVSVDVEPPMPQWGVDKVQIAPEPPVNPALDQDVIYNVSLCSESTTGNIPLLDATLIDTYEDGALVVNTAEIMATGGTLVPPNQIVWDLGDLDVTACEVRTVVLNYPSTIFGGVPSVTNSVEAVAILEGSTEPESIGTDQLTTPFDPPGGDIDVGKEAPPYPIGPGSLGYFYFPFDNFSSNTTLTNFVLQDDIPAEFDTYFLQTGNWTPVSATATVEYSIDNAGSWITLGTVDGDDDDGFTSFAGTVTNVRWVFPTLPIGFATSGGASAPEIRWQRAAGTPDGMFQNCIDATWLPDGQEPTSSCDSVEFTPAVANVDVQKVINPTVMLPDPEADIQISLDLTLRGTSSDNLVDPTLVDLLPAELEFVSWDSVTFVSNIPVGNQVFPNLEVIPGFSAGRTLLRWTWSTTAPPGSFQLDGSAGVPNSWSVAPPTQPADNAVVRVTFTTTLAPGTIVGTYPNSTQVLSETPSMFCTPATFTDDLDFDDDEDTLETGCEATTDFTVISAAAMAAQKWVRGLGGSGLPNVDPLNINIVPNALCPDDGAGRTRFPCVAQENDGQPFEYRLVLTNFGNVLLTDYIVYDVLPYVGDTGVSEALSTFPRESQWQPVLTAELVPEQALPPGSVIEYSNSNDACRPEISASNNESGWQAFCVDDWSAAPPTVITDVRAFRIVMPFEVAPWLPGEEFTFLVNLEIPAGTTPNTVAWNSLAHRSTNGESGERIPTAEPRKVGILVPSATPKDYGDLPESYGTLLADNGASHPIVPGFQLGSVVDAEVDGRPSAPADGDDTDPAGDDEDGVLFTGGMMAGACTTDNEIVVSLNNTAGMQTAFLDAWIDFDGNGVFDTTDQIALSLPLVDGPNTVLYDVPCTAPGGNVFTRFRLSSTGGLEPTDVLGEPLDGEVEDYAFVVKGVDFGDAPDGYGTTQAASGPSHTIIPGFRMGAANDTEFDGQPSAGADGDDTDPEGDDEDGVTFAPGPILATCLSTPITVNLVNSAGFGTRFLDAWVDFDANGSFDTTEHIFGGTSQALSSGNNSLAITTPCTATIGASYARFRLSSVGNLSPTDETVPGTGNGEVEDYLVEIRLADFGDAPDSYGTTLAMNAAAHAIIPGFHMGFDNDDDIEGAPTPNADGDDVLDGNDDEDGVFVTTMPMADICSTGNPLDVSLINSAGVETALLDAWVDFNLNGIFESPIEHLFGAVSQPLAPGGNVLAYSVPCDALAGATYARFRLSEAGGTAPAGPTFSGEVEDYVFVLKSYDQGDAPDSYQTLIASGGPRHLIVPGYHLGAAIDLEFDGQPTAGADGDDLDAQGDDEDGVVFAGGMAMAGACSTGNALTATLTDTAGIGAAFLDAWIDFNGNGAFDNPEEHLFGGSAPLVVGANALTYDVPCGAVPQTTSFARFRLSSGGNLLPFDTQGSVGDGEVEDYVFEVKGIDLGDAPDSYGTTQAASGPSHTIVVGYQLGAANDTEPDGQPSAGADGDDLDVDGDDEDGVVFDNSSILRACTTGSVDVTLTDAAAVGAASLDAWVDFDGNGTFDAGDQIAASEALVPGVNNLTFSVPCDAVPQGQSYSRFRLSSAGGLSPTDASVPGAADGEVEDHVVEIRGVDFGDAPDSYGTTLAQNGPSHTIVPDYQLGAANDTEPDGQPSMGADGDDLDVDGDDEDGVTIPNNSIISACTTNTVDVVLTDGAGIGAAFLDAWVDFDGNGVFDPTDQVADSVALAPGVNMVSFAAPCDAVPQAEGYARFRLSSTGDLDPTDVDGPVADGEVEDYLVVIGGLDFGDAPDPSYPTLLASDGARHVILPNSNPTMGVCVDDETDGQPSALSDADDLNDTEPGCVDDEDGVLGIENPLPAGAVIDLDITVATACTLSAWIDFDDNGSWADPRDTLFPGGLLLAPGVNTVSFRVPPKAAVGRTHARFRCSTAGELAPTGFAPDGEVEDYLVQIVLLSLGDYVWWDTDADGVQDVDELGIPGIRARLYNDPTCSGQAIAQDQTDADGLYLFENLIASEYCVLFSGLDPDWIVSPKDATSDDLDSDGVQLPDPTMAVIEAIDLQADDPNEDLGVFVPGLIGDTVWCDTALGPRNDIFEPGEGMADITVTLYDDTDCDGIGEVQIDQTSTVGDGQYTFAPLPVGPPTPPGPQPVCYEVRVDTADPDLGLCDTNITPIDFATQLDEPSPEERDADFAFEKTGSPTAALVTHPRAYLDSGGGVFEWQTATETGTAGFYVYRWDGEDFALINEALLGAAQAAQGGVYRVRDHDATVGEMARYLVVEIEAAGAIHTYGPYDVEIGVRGAELVGEASAAPRPMAKDRFAGIGNALQQSETLPDAPPFSLPLERGFPSDDGSLQGAGLVQSNGLVHDTGLGQNSGFGGRSPTDAVKAAVAAAGIAEVAYSELASAFGLSLDAVASLAAAGDLEVSHAGTPVAYEAAVNGLRVMSEGSSTIFTADSIYWVRIASGLTMDEVDGGAPLPVLGGTFTDTVRFEQDVFAVTKTSNQHPDEDFWFWSLVQAEASEADLSVDVHSLSALGSIELAVDLLGASDSSHEAVVLVNNIEVGSASWSGEHWHRASFDIEPGVLNNGPNSIRVLGELGQGVPFSLFYVDGLDLTYERLYEAVDQRLTFRPQSGSTVTVRGFLTSNIAVYDVTIPTQPLRVVNTTIDMAGGFQVSFNATAGAEYVVTTAPLASATRVDVPSDLKGEVGAAHLILGPSAFLAEAQRLAELRQEQGLTSMVIDIEDVYDEFAGGHVTPMAIRDFLAHAYGEWQEQPRYVVLLGKGTYDYKDYLGVGDNLVPTLLTVTPDGLFAADARLADFDEDGVPELAIGRIPVVTEAELTAYVDKLERTETGSQLTQDVLLVADDEDEGGAFEASSEALLSYLRGGYKGELIFRGGQTLDQARAQLFEGLDQGAYWVNFVGHGGIDRWASEGLLTSEDARVLTNDHAPVFSSLTCVVGRYEVPGTTSLAEELLINPAGGATATFSPTALSRNADVEVLNQALFEALFHGGGRLGDSVLEALEAFQEAGEPRYLIEVYHLLGDPAQILH